MTAMGRPSPELRASMERLVAELDEDIRRMTQLEARVQRTLAKLARR